MHEPELLLLDEPYAGFDWETYLHFWEMSERRRDAGMGILIVSHLLAERERLDRIYALCDGRTASAERRCRRSGSFVREHLRAPLTLVLLVAIPVFFVLIFASVLGEFAEALGGNLAAQAATAISAGWAAAFLCGTLAFFQVVLLARAPTGALPLAGLGAGAGRGRAASPPRSPSASTVSAVAYVTLWLRSGIGHPLHAAAGDLRLRRSSTSASAP